MLRLDNIDVYYGKIQTLKGVSLTVNDGELVTLAPGERWSKVVGADLKRGPFDGRYEITSSVTNYGWHARARIDGPTQFAWLPMVGR